MPNISKKLPAVESAATPTDLADVSSGMKPVVVASREIFNAAIDDATGSTWQQRRAAVDGRIDAWRERHFVYVPRDDRRPSA